MEQSASASAQGFDPAAERTGAIGDGQDRLDGGAGNNIVIQG